MHFWKLFIQQQQPTAYPSSFLVSLFLENDENTNFTFSIDFSLAWIWDTTWFLIFFHGTSFAFLKIIHPTAAGYPSSVAVQLFRRTWGARWQLFSARAIYQADVLTQPRHNKSSHVIPATSTQLAGSYFSESNSEKSSKIAKIKRREKFRAVFSRHFAFVFVVVRLEKVVKKGGKSACIRCIQRAGCIVWVIYQRQSTKFPSAENLSLLLSSSSPLPHFELFSKKQHWLFFLLFTPLEHYMWPRTSTFISVVRSKSYRRKIKIISSYDQTLVVYMA